MRKLSNAGAAMIMAIALYFTLFWGYDALRMLTSPTFGLEDVWRSQAIFGIGSLLGLGPMGLIKLGAFVGVLKLAVAAICAVHFVDRIRGLGGRQASQTDIFEGGLILSALVSLAVAAPALWSQNADLLRDQIVQIALAGLAASLCILERGYARTAATPVVEADAEAAVVAPGQAATVQARWYSPWR